MDINLDVIAPENKFIVKVYLTLFFTIAFGIAFIINFLTIDIFHQKLKQEIEVLGDLNRNFYEMNYLTNVV